MEFQPSFQSNFLFIFFPLDPEFNAHFIDRQNELKMIDETNFFFAPQKNVILKTKTK